MAGEVGIGLPKRRIGHSIIHARLELGFRLIGRCIILGRLEIILRKLGIILGLLCILRRERRLKPSFDFAGDGRFREENNDGLQSKIVNYKVRSKR